LSEQRRKEGRRKEEEEEEEEEEFTVWLFSPIDVRGEKIKEIPTIGNCNNDCNCDHNHVENIVIVIVIVIISGDIKVYRMRRWAAEKMGKRGKSARFLLLLLLPTSVALKQWRRHSTTQSSMEKWKR